MQAASSSSPFQYGMHSSAATRWSVAFAAALMNCVQTGAFFMAPTTLMPLIVSDLRLAMSLCTVPIAVGKVAYVLLLIPGGMLVDHFGPRRCVLAGVFGIAIMITAYALFVSTFSGLVAMHVCIAAVASVSGVPIYSIFIAQWFENGIGLAMGLVLAGYSAAGTLVPALLGPVATDFGWRAAMGCMSAILWLIGLPIAYLFLHENHHHADVPIDPPSHPIPISVHVHSASKQHIDEGVNETTPILANERHHQAQLAVQTTENKTLTFVGFALSYILLQYCFGCFGENIMFFLTVDRGVSLATASLYLSALNFASFTAKLVGGHLGDRFDRFHVAAVTSGLAGVGILILFCTGHALDEHYIPYLTKSHITMLIFIFLFGFGYGATFNSLYALVPIVFGRKNLGTTQSSLFGLGLAGNAVGSVLTGVLRAHYGTYQRPFLIAAVACIANFVTFNVTRLTLGGSVANLKGVPAPSPVHIPSSGTFSGIEELELEAEALRARIGAPSEDDDTPRRSPMGSISSLFGSGFFGASFAASPSAESFFNRMSPPAGARDSPQFHHSFTDIDLDAAIIRAVSAEASQEDGLRPDSGFLIARDWSSHSLKSGLTRQRQSGSRVRGVRRSNTAGNMIRSGVMSASMESPGYLGYTR